MSADLVELARTEVLVAAAGIKSLLALSRPEAAAPVKAAPGWRKRIPGLAVSMLLKGRRPIRTRSRRLRPAPKSDQALADCGWFDLGLLRKRRVSAQHTGQPRELPDHGHAVLHDLDLEQFLGVVAVAQLDDRKHAPHLRLQLGVAEEDDVVCDEGESLRELESGSKERGRLARQQRGGADGGKEARQRGQVVGEASRAARRRLELGQAVDHDTAHAALAERRLAQLGADGVETDLDRLEMTDPEQPRLDRRLERPAECLAVRDQLFVGLLEGEVQAVLAAGDSVGDEVQSENRLAGTRRARDQGRAPAGQAAADLLVDSVDAKRHALAGPHLAGRGDRLEAGKITSATANSGA